MLWNHRWDHDKNPEALFRSLVKLADEGVDFRVAVAGENTRVDPREFTEACYLLGDRVVAPFRIHFTSMADTGLLACRRTRRLQALPPQNTSN